MSLSALAVKNRIVTYFFVMLLLIAGTGSFFMLGQLEDPEFTVKTAVIVTPYPGASPREVELEVTDRIELAIQEMPQVDYLKSFSRAGLSLIEVNIKPEYWSDRLPQVWDELRRKVNDYQGQLPPGAGPSLVNATCIIAPNRPVATWAPSDRSLRTRRCSSPPKANCPSASARSASCVYQRWYSPVSRWPSARSGSSSSARSHSSAVRSRSPSL